ncbi:MAG: sulfite oxidase [Chthoniobacterales bacterium]
MPFSSVDGFITPNESFYVRCHFPVPQIARRDWRLQVAGDVEEPFEIGYDDMREMESRTISATLECAGNNRRFLEPKVKGVQWGLGAVGNAAWQGVPLATLLSRAKPKPGAIEVILEGADEGPLEERWAPPGNTRFARSLPLAKAQEDVLLAYEMNGEELSDAHGFPLRAIVPGWYAMASVKWLRRIVVTSSPFDGYYQALDYAYWERAHGLARRVPLREMQVKAQISQPENGERVRTDTTIRIHGAAWGAGHKIAKVEFSSDGGESWREARLIGEGMPNAWQLWEYDWRTPSTPQRSTLRVRATDSSGQTQPMQHDSDRGGYMINQIVPINVEVVEG